MGERRPWRATVIAGVAAAALVACSSSPIGAGADNQGYVSGTGVISKIDAGNRESAPTLQGPLLGGTGIFDLASTRGKVVVVNVWASWCSPCRSEAPALESAWNSLRSSPVQFVGINTRDRGPNAEAFTRRFGMTYPSVVDEDGRLMLSFRDLPPNAVPSTLILDRQGRVAVRVTGEVSESTVRGLVEDELGTAPSA